jgi:PKHD-type hydroxylase
LKLIKPRQMADWQPYVFYDKCFSPSECEAIIHIARALKPEPASTLGGQDKAVRSSEVRWMRKTKSSRWVFDKLIETVLNIQQNWYPFNLSGFLEPIQITRYLSSEEGHYSEHRDFGPANMSTRKLSLVMQLNDSAAFEGGALDILAIAGADKSVKQAAQGNLVAFPAWELHRVNKVTSGERWSLVSWIHGEPFR